MRLISIIKPKDRLIVVKETGVYRKQYNLLTAVFGGSVLVLLGYAMAVHMNPRMFVFMLILVVVMLALLVKAYEVRRLAENRESFCFDREQDRLMLNGQVLTPLTDIDHILVRQIRPEDDRNLDVGQYALVVALEDTRRITLAETLDMPDAKQDIEEAAREIADFLQVKVEQGTRTETEWWLDHSGNPEKPS